MDKVLLDRWISLVAAVKEEAWDHDQDPNVVEANEEALKITLPLDDSARFATTFTEEQVLSVAPRRLASDLYSAYVSVRIGEPPGEASA